MIATAPGTEAERLVAWRFEQLLELGCPLDDAEALAEAGLSWHDFERLIEAGCPPAAARAILL